MNVMLDEQRMYTTNVSYAKLDRTKMHEEITHARCVQKESSNDSAVRTSIKIKTTSSAAAGKEYNAC